MINRLKNLYYSRKTKNFFNIKFSIEHCPLCETKVLFVSFDKNIFTRCIVCRNTCLNLGLIPIIKEILPVDSAYELSTYGGTHDFLKKNVSNLSTSEFFPNHQLGKYVDGIRNEDVQKLSFADKEFDLVTSNQVFEHVPDDIKGFKEINRVLKNGGFFIFGIPLYNIPKTLQRAYIKDGKIFHIELPEYHGSRLEGPNSVLTFWKHSKNDIVQRLEKAGFEVEFKDIMVSRNQGKPFTYLKCQKYD